MKKFTSVTFTTLNDYVMVEEYKCDKKTLPRAKTSIDDFDDAPTILVPDDYNNEDIIPEDYGSYVVISAGGSNSCSCAIDLNDLGRIKIGDIIIVQHSMVQKACFDGRTFLFVKKSVIPLKVTILDNNS